MKAFYGSKISNNMTKTPDGFLVCHNVPIARTGWYEYLESELKDNGSPTETVQVYRGPNEVFSTAAIASFEGKPVTDEHPLEAEVTPETSNKYTKGATQNVRQDSKEKDLLVADLIIYDKELIDEIGNGKREISCGYECDYVLVDGTYCQTNIRGNHIAVVDAGRAGHRVRIKDSDIKKRKNNEKKGEQNSMSKTLKKLTRKKRPVNDFLVAVGLKHVATDAEPEDLVDVVDALQEENTSCDEESAQEPKKDLTDNETPEDGTEKSTDTDPIAALTEQVSKLTEIVTGLVQSQNKEKTSDEIIDEMINELGGEQSCDEQEQCDEDQIDEEESVTIPAENIDEDTTENDEESESETSISNDAAIKIAALNAIKPVIAQIKDPKARKKACDSLKKQFMNTKPKKKSTVDGYGNIMNTKRKVAKQRIKNTDSRANTNVQEIGDNIYSKYNANAPKGGNQ